MRSTPYHHGEHVPDDQLGAPLSSCPSCGFDGARPAFFTLQHAPTVTLQGCPQCGISSASRMPTDTLLQAYYARYYNDDDDAVTFHGLDRFGAHLASHVKPRRTMRLLDFGGGDGAVAIATAKVLQAKGAMAVDVTVVDFADPITNVPAGVTLTRVRHLDELPPAQRFDMVIASAILEHIPQVGDTMRQLFARADSKATFYARTPYWAPFLRFMPKLDLTFPGHVHDMGAPFWSRVIDTFALDATMLRSQPSIVETTLRQDPFRTVAAHALKFPSRVEVAIRGSAVRRPLWPWVGGWEVFLRFADRRDR